MNAGTSVHACMTCVCVLRYSFTVQEAEVPVSVRQLLQVFRDGDLMEKNIFRLKD